MFLGLLGFFGGSRVSFCEFLRGSFGVYSVQGFYAGGGLFFLQVFRVSL